MIAKHTLAAAACLLLVAACTPAPNVPDLDGGAIGGLDAGSEEEDAGSLHDAGPLLCEETLPVGPPCCDASGARLMGADCSVGGWTCEEGALCECEGEGASFFCTDVCGSDAFTDPTCGESGWTCAGLVRSDSCPAGTCWGLPGDCCINPSCVDGSWQCESIQDPCE